MGTQRSECRIWVSTKTRFGVNSEPLLSNILQAYPIHVIKGLPVLALFHNSGTLKISDNFLTSNRDWV